jgi:hypothetical protein
MARNTKPPAKQCPFLPRFPDRAALATLRPRQHQALCLPPAPYALTATTIELVLDKSHTAVHKAWEVLTDTADAARSYVAPVAEKFSSSGTGQVVSAKAADALGVAKSMAAKVSDRMTHSSEEARDAFSATIDHAREFAFERATEAFGDARETATNLASSARETATHASDAVKQAVSKQLKVAKDATATAFEDVIVMAQGNLRSVALSMSGVLDGAEGLLAEALSSVRDTIMGAEPGARASDVRDQFQKVQSSRRSSQPSRSSRSWDQTQQAAGADDRRSSKECW